MKTLLLGLVLLLAGGLAGAQTLNPAADAYVRGGAAAGNNYGGVVLLGVRTASNELNTYQSYLKFNTSGVAGTIRSAKLRLFTALSSSGSVQTNLYASSAAWGEGTITWNNKPALGTQLASFTVANTGYVWFELDVSAYVRSQQGQAETAFALANPAQSSQLVAVQSRESANPAQLVIVLDTPPTVSLTAPASGAIFPAGAGVPVTASASDPDGTIAKVEFFDGATLAATSGAGSFMKMYLIPNMGHCSGNMATDRFDMLTPMVNWVENGVAPEEVIATGSQFMAVPPPGPYTGLGSATRSRPLCPYPKTLRYKGAGDISQSSSYACQ